MRILQLCSAREIGGGERHLIDLSRRLADRGHDIFVAANNGSPLQGEFASTQNVKVRALPIRFPVPTAAPELKRFVTDNSIELIHAHVATDYPLAALLSRLSGVPYVLTRHVLFPMRRVHKMLLRGASRVIAVSGAVRNSLIAQSIFDEEKIVTIHNGIDVDKFALNRNSPPTGRRTKVGTIGHLSPIKGQEEFIRAASLISSHRDDVDFGIVGSDKSRDRQNEKRLRALVAELRVDDRVHFEGWQPDVTSCLADLDIFVSCARQEPFGLAIVEAMASGLPVISTRSEGALEIIEDNVTGRLVPIGDVQRIAEAIASLLENPTQRYALGVEAARAVRERFSLDQMVAATESIYSDVLVSMS